ncbi:MAG: hypothetical protein ACRBF0_25395 [Calditrichia bacterium]
MLGVLKKIDRILYERITWNPENNEEGKFTTSSYSRDDCWIQMNDFPEEPLWTLYYRGESKDIEDTPTIWKVNYANESPST